jgi:toxin ParE1/3/4
MARRIVWAEKALAEFQGMLDYIHRRNPQGIATILRKVGTTVSLLAERPHGRPGRVAGTYEKSVSGLSYVVAYELDDSTPDDPALVVLRVIHTARDWPSGEWPK